METKKRTELIESIIKQFFPNALPYSNYSREAVMMLCNAVWDTANNELDEICELKAEKAELERRLEELQSEIEYLKEQHKLDLETEYQKGRDDEESYRLDLDERYS